MLTISQPTHYGYRSVHDLPTPPSTSRSSPPLTHQEDRKYIPAIPRRSSPAPMSAPHRGLPPPAAMSLPQQPLQSSGAPQPSLPPPSGPSVGQSHHSHPYSPPQQSQMHAQLPSAPSWGHVSEETMRAYLSAKGEEEKRRQEEEKTRQATLLLDQRRMEHEILQSSLQGGIPPPMVPFVFAGMGGGVLPQAAIEWAHNYLQSQSQQAHTPALLPPGQISASPRRESQAQGYGPSTYSGSAVPSTPGSAQGPSSWYPGSPTRPRGQSMSSNWPSRQPASASQNLPSLDTTFPVRAGGDDRRPAHPGSSSAQQQEQTPSLYFHHWQPPPAQSSSSRRDSGTDQPGPSPKKRKTSVSRPAPPSLSGANLPSSQTATLSNPPPGRRGGHSRQRSDLGTYRSYAGRFDLRSEGFGPPAAGSSGYATTSFASREAAAATEAGGPSSLQPPQPQQTQRSGGAHPVSSLLSDENPSQAAQRGGYYSPRGASDMPSQPSGALRRGSPSQTSYYTPREATQQGGGGGAGGDQRGSPEETTRGGASQTAHERQNIE